MQFETGWWAFYGDEPPLQKASLDMQWFGHAFRLERSRKGNRPRIEGGGPPIPIVEVQGRRPKLTLVNQKPQSALPVGVVPRIIAIPWQASICPSLLWSLESSSSPFGKPKSSNKKPR
jgi:hypothetical protein